MSSRRPFRLRIPRPMPFVAGRLVSRYKRFFVDVELASGEVVTAHCANTGALEGLTQPGLEVWLSPSANPARKLAWSLELVASPPGFLGSPGERLVGAHTGLPNQLVQELFDDGALDWLAPYDQLQAERRYGTNSRVDFWACHRGKETYVEVKNCHLAYPDGFAYFPDGVSERAVKHLAELTEVVQQGHRAVVLFVCQAGPVQAVRPSDVHDPEFAAAARAASKAGVRFEALTVTHTPREMVVEGPVPVHLALYPTAPVAAFRAALRPETTETPAPRRAKSPRV